MKIPGYNFPLFLAEAKGEFYRRIEITVRFKKAPTDGQKAKLKKLTPAYFEEKPIFAGRMLSVGAGKILSQMHQEDIQKMRKSKHDSGYAFYLKGFKDIQTFDRDMRDWLEELDEICPIQFVLCDETDMGKYLCQGGEWTHVSDRVMSWHEKSADTLESLLEELNERADTYEQEGDERRIFSYCIKALDKGLALRYEFVDLEEYPKLIDFIKDELWLERFFKKQDLKGLMKIMEENASGNYVDTLIYEDLGSLFSASFRAKTSTVKKTKWMLDLAKFLYSIQNAWEICFPFGSPLARLAKFAAENQDSDLLEKIASHTQTGFRSESHIKRFGEEGFELIQKKKFKEAIELFKLAVMIDLKEKPIYPDYSLYCNALWVLLKGNTGLPVNPDLNRLFIKRCLLHAPHNPAIYCNVANLYAEMAEFEKAYEYFLLTKEHDEKNYELMVNEIKSEESLAGFREFLEKRKGMSDLYTPLLL